MAEFGISATQLAEPQGSGARAVAPVETMNIGPNPMFKIAQNVTDIFAKGIQANRKQEAEALKSSVVKSYYEEVNKITSGVEQGSVKPAEASVRARNLLSRFLAQNPGLTTELREAANTLSTFSTLGSIEDQVKADRETRKRQLADAEKEGLVLSPGASVEEEDAVIRVNALTIQNQRAFEKMAERKRFDVTMAAAERDAFKYKDEMDSFRMVNEVAGARFEQFNLYSDGLRKAVSNGKLTVSDARSQLTRQAGEIRSQLLAASRVNPQFANAYGKIFEDTLQLQLKLVDPATASEDLTNQFKALKNKALYMAATSDPEVLAAMAVADAFPNSPQLQISLGTQAIKALAVIKATPVGQTVPTVIGATDTKLEKEVVGAFKETMKGYTNTSEDRKAVSEIQAGNTAAHILTQTGEAVDKGKLSAESLLGVVTGISDPGFHKLVSQGQVPQEALQQGAKAIQVMFGQTERSLMDKLDMPVMTATTGAVFNRKDARAAKAPPAEGKEKKLIDAVEFVAAPGGVSIVLKDAGKTPSEQNYNRQLMAELSKVERVVNTAVRAAAHLGGTNDYKKYWEENKHVIVPSLFPAPAEGKPKFGTEGDAKKAATVTKGDVDAVKGQTADALQGLLKDFDKLSPEQVKQLNEAMKQLGMK